MTERPPRPRTRRDDEPTLPDRSRDDSDVGWGESRDAYDHGERDEAWYRRERPPHHGD